MPPIELPNLSVIGVTGSVATSRLVLINRDPGPQETGVSLDAALALEIVDLGGDGVDRSATQVYVDGVIAFDGSTGHEFQPGFDGPRAAVSQAADTVRVVLDPTVPFASQATVQVRVVSQTNGGGHTLDESYSFIAEDQTAPKVVEALAIGPKVVAITFDEDVVVTDEAGFALLAKERPAVPVSIVSAHADGQVVTITLDTEMTPDVAYRVVASGVSDTHGNPVMPPDDSTTFMGFRSPRPPSRRFDLWSMLPRHSRRTDDTGDLWRFIACLQEVVDLLLAEVDRYPDIFDLERAPEGFLDLILRDLGNPFPFDLDAIGKRRLASVLVEMYGQKGTAAGIRNAIRFFLGIEATITGFAEIALVLGESELGEDGDWVLGPSDRFARYAFDLQVDRLLSATERRQILAIADYMKPAHTHLRLVEPIPPPAIDHWELAISELGETTDLHTPILHHHVWDLGVGTLGSPTNLLG